MTATEIDPINVQMVGSRGDQVVVNAPHTVMTPDDALRHAAWLVQVAEVLGAEHTFDEYQQAVRNT